MWNLPPPSPLSLFQYSIPLAWTSPEANFLFGWFQVESTPEPDFMLKQTSVSLEMRAILVDWLVDVAKDYKLQPETFFLTVKYLDQFLASAVVLRSRLQLVGTAAMFLAS